MDEINQNSSSLLSLQQLLEELEKFVVLESEKSGRHWISITRLNKLFGKQYGVLPEEAAKAQGYRSGLRNFLQCSNRFSIYPTPVPQKFYIALLQAIVPKLSQSQPTSVRILIADGAKENPPSQAPEVLEYKPNSISEVKSENDLELVLTKIIKSLIVNNPKRIVTLSALSKNFLNDYNQPIKPVMRRVFPGIKLIDLLQTMPNLHVQKMDDDWQITLEGNSVE